MLSVLYFSRIFDTYGPIISIRLEFSLSICIYQFCNKVVTIVVGGFEIISISVSQPGY